MIKRGIIHSLPLLLALFFSLLILSCGAAPDWRESLQRKSELGQWDEALELVDAQVEAHPQDYTLWALKSSLERNAGNLEGAILSAERALELNEDFTQGYVTLGLYQFARDDVPAAREAWQRAGNLYLRDQEEDPATFDPVDLLFVYWLLEDGEAQQSLLDTYSADSRGQDLAAILELLEGTRGDEFLDQFQSVLLQ